MGTGHVMRCLALAEAWQEQCGPAVFLGHCDSRAVRDRVERSGARFEQMPAPHPDPGDLERTIACMQDTQADWLVVDGYHFDPSFQQGIREAGHRLMVIDDTAHWPAYHADVLLNQNIGAEDLAYSHDPDTALLLGTAYALLRSEFLHRPDRERPIPEVGTKVLVTLGGAGMEETTLKVIESLSRMDVPGLKARIVVGPASEHADSVKRAAAAAGDHVQVEESVEDMAELMTWADVAVSAGGSTCWELAFLGLPALLTTVADNQARNVLGLHEANVALNLGAPETVTPDNISTALAELLRDMPRRIDMSKRGQQLVDGEGAARAIMRLRDMRFRLRLARPEDAESVWKLSNEPAVRQASFSSEPIPWDRHVTWFRDRLADPACHFFIAVTDEDELLGQIRFDVEDAAATVSVSLEPRFRGQGYGTEVIGEAARCLFRSSADASCVHACIKPGNAASLAAFQDAGFRENGRESVKGLDALRMTLARKEYDD